MARKPNPLRIYAAHQDGILGRLKAEGRLSTASAERWIAAREAEARARGLDARTGRWWDPAWDWIAKQRGG